MGSPLIRAIVVTVVIVILGVLMDAYLSVDATIKRILKIIGGLVILIVWLIWLFGILGVAL